jgi:hypothetical protein
VKRRQVVTQRRGPTPQTPLQPTDPVNPGLDLAGKTYLTVFEASRYLSFNTEKAFYSWVDRHSVPKCRRGGRLLFLRRDLDEAVQKHRQQAGA